MAPSNISKNFSVVCKFLTLILNIFCSVKRARLMINRLSQLRLRSITGYLLKILLLVSGGMVRKMFDKESFLT